LTAGNLQIAKPAQSVTPKWHKQRQAGARQ
jgi:hypothetical protein